MTEGPEKVIGVLGGMGPEATLSFYEKVIANTPARRDQDHLRVVIDANPKVPDRTAALLHDGDSPVPMMVAGLEALALAGADFVVIPCVTAHGFLEDLRHRAVLPLVSMLEVMADHVRGQHPGVKSVGLLATTGTVESGAFAEALGRGGIDVLLPGNEDQQAVMAAIYAIKGSPSAEQRQAARGALLAVAERLVSAGAQAIVLGCTELPLVVGRGDLAVPVLDSVLILARAAITLAGREPRPAEPS
jgi:aspartate racemase